MKKYTPAENLVNDLINDMKKLDGLINQEYELLEKELNSEEDIERISRVNNIFEIYEDSIKEEIQRKYDALIDVVNKGFNIDLSSSDEESLKLVKVYGKMWKKKIVSLTLPSHLDRFEISRVSEKINYFIKL